VSKTVKVAEVDQLQPGRGIVVEADGYAIALFNLEGEFYAIENECPHEDGPLGEGEVDGETVSCPWHGARFNIKTGAVASPPAFSDVAVFPTIVRGRDVFVEVK